MFSIFTKHFVKSVICGGALLSVAPVFAQIEVIDAAPETVYRDARGVAQSAAPAKADSTGELFYQLQLLQEEVLQLRGIVEQQQHEIRRLQKQRMDDYINLDKRLSSLTAGKPTGSASAVSSQTKSSASSQAQQPAAANEQQAYKNAYDLVKARKFAEATNSFLSYLKVYPQGSMAPNAHYWLGELYFLDGKLEQAKARFDLFLQKYNTHRKVPDASFKLAKLYDLKGDSAKSQLLLERVISKHPNSSAAGKAKEYLRQNF